MNLFLQYRINSNPNYVRFLRENSYWYKYLNRSSLFFDSFDKDMKVKYKLTISDRIDKFSKDMDKLSQIIDIFS